jgi:nitrate reductase beta subunit
MLFVAHFGMLCAVCALDEAVVYIICSHYATCVQKIKFIGVVVFEKKRFEAIVEGNA